MTNYFTVLGVGVPRLMFSFFGDKVNAVLCQGNKNRGTLRVVCVGCLFSLGSRSVVVPGETLKPH